MDSKTNQIKSKLIIRSLYISGSLAILKIAVGIWTNSLAILATAADSVMDFLVSLANLIFVRGAQKPADEDHPYGHGKLESLAGLIQSIFMGLVALTLAGASIHRFMNPQPIDVPWAGIAIMAVAIILNFWHVRNLRRVMQETGSQIMATEYVHYASDFLTHLGVVASILLYQITGFPYWDPLMSFLIVFYILFSIGQIFNSALGELLDQQLPDIILSEIKETIMAFHPKIIDFHDLRTRKVGETKFIEFHVELKDVTEFEEAHNITENLITELKEKYPKSVITVHTDPEGAR